MATNITSIADMQIVPSKFTAYTVKRTTEKSTLVKSGLTTTSAELSQLINGQPQGGNIITMPFFNPLSGEDEVFGEGELAENKITTGNEKATLLVRGKMWGDTDLSRVFGGADPLAAVGDLIADWWVGREQAIILAILKALTDPAAGALKSHVNDISSEAGDASIISDGASLETKQTMGDAFEKIGTVFMHSMTFTYLQRNKLITQLPVIDNSLSPLESMRYLGYRIIVDDGLPAANGVYDTYFLGAGCLARADGVPSGLVTTETDRNKKSGMNYLINRRALVLHPIGVSWVAQTFIDNTAKYAANADLAVPANWQLVVDHKNVPITCLRHRLEAVAGG
jgi:hypothetical protein